MQDTWHSVPRRIYKGKYLTDGGHNHTDEKFRSPEEGNYILLFLDYILRYLNWKYLKVPKNISRCLKKFKIFEKFQDIQKISKFSKKIKIFEKFQDFEKSKVLTNFKIFKKIIRFSKNLKIFENFLNFQKT